MGWMYMVVCFFDFVVAPILWSLLQAVFHGGVNIQWQPLTLQGAGLFHVAMGAVLGLAAWGRTQEKLNGANNGGIALPSNVGTTYTPPAAVPQPAASAVSVPTATATTVAPVPSWGTTPIATTMAAGPVTIGWGGRPAPPQPDFYPER